MNYKVKNADNLNIVIVFHYMQNYFDVECQCQEICSKTNLIGMNFK